MNLPWHNTVTQRLVHFGGSPLMCFLWVCIVNFHHYESAWHLGSFCSVPYSLVGTYKGEGVQGMLYRLYRRKWLSTCYLECSWVWPHLGAMQKLSGPSPAPALPDSASILTRSPSTRVSSPFLSLCCPRERTLHSCVNLRAWKLISQGLKLESWKPFLLERLTWVSNLFLN